MLQAIREKAQGWIAWAIVILISIPFALWGIQEYLGVGSEAEVAVIEGDPITERMLDQRVRDFRESLRLSLGDNYREDLFNDSVLKSQVLGAMIEERVLANRAEDWNLRTSDQQARGYIASIPAFQRDGSFDQLAYETAVRNRGMSRAGFEQSVRQDLTLGQLRAGIAATAFLTEADLQARVRLTDQKRTLAYARIPKAAYRDQIGVSEAELRAYYDANVERYRTPERVKLRYLELDASVLKDLVEVSDDVLRQYFEDHRAEFVAREEREMRHILIAVPSGADAAAELDGRTKASDLLQQIRAGADFATLATQNSDDPGSAQAGGDLGWVERDLMVPPFEEAAFALGEGEVSDLVRTDFGFHIIQVTGIRGGGDTTFDDVREQVEAAYRRFEAENLYFDYAERLAESAYENSDSLTPAAEALGLQVQDTDWVTRDGQLPGTLDSPRVMVAAFSDDVLNERHNSELIEIGSQKAVVVRVAEHEPAGVESFNDIKADVEKDYIDDRASQIAAETGTQLIEQLQAGETTLEQAASTHAWQIENPGAVAREAAGLPAEVVAEAFRLKPPAEGQTVHSGVVSAEGDYMLIAVSGVEDGRLEALTDAERPFVTDQAVGELRSAQMRYFTQTLRERADVDLLLKDD